MNKTLLVVLIAGVLGIGGYFYFEKEGNEMAEQTASQTEEGGVKQTGKKIAFSQFVNQGGSYKCTVHQFISDTDTTGTMFVDKGLMRGMFETETQGVKVSSNILVREGFTYTWSSTMPQGIKMAVKKDEGGVDTSTSGANSWNVDDVGDYECVAWDADQTTFVVPSNIVFMDLADLGSMYKR